MGMVEGRGRTFVQQQCRVEIPVIRARARLTFGFVSCVKASCCRSRDTATTHLGRRSQIPVT
jgi:hypothetical protein